MLEFIISFYVLVLLNSENEAMLCCAVLPGMLYRTVYCCNFLNDFNSLNIGTREQIPWQIQKFQKFQSFDQKIKKKT